MTWEREYALLCRDSFQYLGWHKDASEAFRWYCDSAGYVPTQGYYRMRVVRTREVITVQYDGRLYVENRES